MKDHIEDSLDLMPMNSGNNLPVIIDDKDEDDAIEVAKNAFKDLIDKSEEALEEMLTIAKQSQHPQAFNSLSKLIKTVAELHTGLLDIQQPKAKGTFIPGEQPQQAQTINNTNVFVGTTAELAKLIENAKNEYTEPESED